MSDDVWICTSCFEQNIGNITAICSDCNASRPSSSAAPENVAITSEILKQLNIDSYHPGKLTWGKVVTIHSDISNQQNGLNVVRKLLMMDIRAPYSFQVNAKSSEGSVTLKRRSRKPSLTPTSEKCTVSNANILHPMDVMIAVYNCCDKMLLQLLVSKLFMCRMSVPIIYPDIEHTRSQFSVWTLQGVVAEWRNRDGTLNQGSIVGVNHPIISFFRIGELRRRRSKSQLLNSILSSSTSQHSTFFHREGKFGTTKRMVSNGIVEASWFLPSGNQMLRDMFSVWNLRGEATEFQRELQFLLQASSLCVLMMSTSSLKDKEYNKLFDDLRSARGEYNQCQFLLSFVRDPADQFSEDVIETMIDECEQVLNDNGASVIDSVCDWNEEGTPLNSDEWKAETVGVISDFLENYQPIWNIRDLQQKAQQCGLKIDNDESYYNNAKRKIACLLDPLQEIPYNNRKSRLLPLQGKPWREWVDLQKRLHREKKSENVELFIEENFVTQKQARQEQLQLFIDPSCDFSKQFITCLTESTEPNEIEFMLASMKLRLDDWSRSPSADSPNDYHQLSSFGLEHVLRELGQIYEATTLSDKSDELENEQRQRIERLPCIAANLLLNGIPFELMDGDAAFVPLAWVKAVFNELEKMIDNKTLFVLSVVGVQSSGKSTLLNTMFGLQFAVSAGRCTKGVYCQLIAVEKENTKLPCEYIMVIDTEGLRAPELQHSSLVHDNELATFVVGLGDLTIVNIKGEIAADVQDILQIVIHAMLRIKLTKKKVELTPSCVFVHQNVSSVSAVEKMKPGKNMFHSFLDRITVSAAEHEKCTGYNRFDQVIQFDQATNVHYVPDLWQGEPPMTTVNCAYNDKIEQIREMLLNDIVAKQNKPLTTSRLASRIEDLWNAILCENFVFSFKNSEEIKAFLALETFIANITWDLKNECLKLQNRSVQRIKSCEDNLELLETQILSEISNVLNDKQKTLQIQMQAYFDGNECGTILEQWRSRCGSNIATQCRDELSNIERYVKNCIHRRRLMLSNAEVAKTHAAKVLTLAREKAEELKASTKGHILNEEELQLYFEQEWQKWTSDLARCSNQEDTMKIVLLSMEDELHKHFFAHRERLNSMLVEYPLTDISKYNNFHTIIKMDCKDIKVDAARDEIEEISVLGVFKRPATPEEIEFLYLNKAREACGNVLTEIGNYVHDLKGYDFNAHHIKEVFKMLDTFFKQMEANREVNRYSLQFEFVIKFTIYVSKCAANEFVELRNAFLKETDPLARVIENKKHLCRQFKITYSDIANDQRAAQMFSILLSKWITDALSSDIARIAADDVINHDSTFQTKHTFMNKVLTDLCRNRNFHEYLNYLGNGETFLKNKILEYRNHFLNESEETEMKRIQAIIVKEVGIYLSQIRLVSYEVESMTFQNPKEFIDALQSKLNQTNLSLSSCDIRTLNIKDPKSFIGYLKDCLNDITSEIVANHEGLQKHLDGSELDNLLADKVLGCGARCPFCGALCCRTEKDHLHSTASLDFAEDVPHRAIQHYPIGLRGIGGKQTRKLQTYNCQSIIDSDFKIEFKESNEHFKNYKQHYPNWIIDPDRSNKASLYWKWVMKTFNEDFAKHYNTEKADIPESWTEITQVQALASLKM